MTGRDGLAASRGAMGLVQRAANPRRTRVRPFPFPYRAGFSITNGVRGFSIPVFKRIFEFLCGEEETTFGAGLGLELGFAFTLDQVSARPTLGHAIAGAAVPTDSELQLVRGLIEAGWIDTIREVSHEQRFSIALETLHKDGLLPAVSIDALNTALPSEFVSTEQLLERENFGNDFSAMARARALSLLETYKFEQWFDWAELSAEERQRRFGSTLQVFDSSHNAYPFKRFRGELTPTSATFPSQVTSLRLDILQQRGGAVVVEQNLALWSLIGAAEQKQALKVASGCFDLHGRVAWNDIADRAKSGDLLVCTASRLLRWLDLRENLQFDVDASDELWVIFIGGRRRGRVSVAVNRADLSGLALNVESGAPAVKLVLASDGKEIECVRRADPVHKGYDALLSPWVRLDHGIVNISGFEP